MNSLLLLLAFLAPAEPPPLDDILARLAANQERAIEARARVVYQQKTRSRLLRGGGKLAREEWREYTVTPTPDGTTKERVSFRGQYERGGKLHPYDDPKFRHKDVDLDGEILEDLTDDLVNDRKSRDGLSTDLFPLTRAEQRHYTFQFKGTRKVAGRDAWIVAFEPRKEEEGRPWSGEVAIDPEACQPLLVTTKLGKIIPGWVRVVFGINLKQLGFSVTYREVAPELWFPATYGSEFFLRVFFGYARTITMSLENSDFRFASADSTITYDLAGLRPARLRAEWLDNPEGLGTPRPRLSWIVTSEETNQRQTAYRILAARTREALDRDDALWDSGRVASAETLNIEYRGAALASGDEAWWKVKVWDAQDRESAWSEPARFSIGLLQLEDWHTDWISHRDETPLPTVREPLHLPPPRYYRGTAHVSGPIRRAVLHVTALGLADPYINGRRVTDAVFLPGWSDYHQRAYSRAFDVTALVREGPNALGAVVADGWYSGYLGYGLLVGYGPHKLGRFLYGKTPALRMQLAVELASGERHIFGTTPAWRVTTGPELEADMLMGETYDARLALKGWAEPDFDDSAWPSAIRASALPALKAPFFDAAGEREIDLGFQAPPVIQPYPAPPIRATEEIRPVSFKEQAPGVWIFDLGQNIAGVARLRVEGPAGTRVQLRFGEMLHPDGRLMTENLRKARAADSYILAGTGAPEQWTPRFTYHGFRYVEVTGLPAPPTAETITGIVLHSDTPLTSEFEASDPLLTQLHKNIVWTQRGNFVEVPTDCPQRDERLGWTGDAQIYARAAAFNADTAAFMTKWLDDLTEAQNAYGAFTDYAPYPMTHGPRKVSWGTAWMDAGVTVPWTQWRVYGDTRLLERHWPAISRFLDFRLDRDQKLEGLDEGNNWGDWLSLKEQTPLPLIDLAYHAGSLAKGAEMAAAIGRDEEAQRLRDRWVVVQRNFARRFIDTDCALSVQTQSAHALALQFNLTGERCRQPIADALARRIQEAGGRMATGFLGTYPLPHVLTENGHHELAARLVQSREFPSWGYEIENGATTIWERWDSYTKDQGFQNASMNSFSHYAFGAVSEWMFRRLAGIDTAEPGHGRLRIEPRPGGTLDWVRAAYDSPRGRIRSEWRKTGEGLEVLVEIPANTSAEVVLRGAQGEAVRHEIGSGRWRFLNGRPASASPE